MEEFLRFILVELVEYPDELVITKTETEDRTILLVAARKSDIPKIIGKGGHTIQALRSLVSAAAQRRDQSVSLEIIE